MLNKYTIDKHLDISVTTFNHDLLKNNYALIKIKTSEENDKKKNEETISSRSMIHLSANYWNLSIFFSAHYYILIIYMHINFYFNWL